MADYGLPNACNCCAPTCPVLILEGQSQQLVAGQCGYLNYDGQYRPTFTTEYELEPLEGATEPVGYESRTTTKAFRPNGTCESTSVETEGYQLGAACITFTEPTIDEENPLITTYSGTRLNGDIINFTETFSGDVKTNANLTDVVDAYLSTWDNAANVFNTAFFYADFTQVDGVDTEFYSEVYINKSRYRYRIPEGTNTYMKYVVEETFTPADHDPQDPEASPIVVVEKTLEWLGGVTVDEEFIPATPGDDDTWATEWQTLECPAPGIKTLELIKYKCYTGGAWVGA